jgi:hypothetical protein
VLVLGSIQAGTSNNDLLSTETRSSNALLTSSVSSVSSSNGCDFTATTGEIVDSSIVFGMAWNGHATNKWKKAVRKFTQPRGLAIAHTQCSTQAASIKSQSHTQTHVHHTPHVTRDTHTHHCLFSIKFCY